MSSQPQQTFELPRPLARTSRKNRPLASALALGMAFVGLMALERDHPAPPWFLIANAATLLAAILAGAAVRGCSATGRPVSPSAEA
jgi:hypothetical protein